MVCVGIKILLCLFSLDLEIWKFFDEKEYANHSKEEVCVIAKSENHQEKKLAVFQDQDFEGESQYSL